MRPRLDQLEALLWIVRLGSFRAAARQLHLSQPAISGRIRELEGVLAFAVVDRTEFRPGITPKGAEVVRYAEPMIVLAESFRRRFAKPGLLPTTIRMGAADSFALTLLSALLTRIAERHPGMEIELTIEFSRPRPQASCGRTRHRLPDGSERRPRSDNRAAARPRTRLARKPAL
jgi:DNA-binding transcriptional LysR family regulator